MSPSIESTSDFRGASSEEAPHGERSIQTFASPNQPHQSLSSAAVENTHWAESSGFEVELTSEEFNKIHNLNAETDFADRLFNILNTEHPDYVVVDGLGEYREEYLIQKYMLAWAEFDLAGVANWVLNNLELAGNGAGHGLITVMTQYLSESSNGVGSYLEQVYNRDSHLASEVFTLHANQSIRNGNEQALKRWAENLSSPELKEQVFKTMFDSLIYSELDENEQISPGDLVYYLNSVQDSLSADDVDAIADRIINTTSPTTLTSELSTIIANAPDLERSLLKSGVTNLVHQNPDAAKEWIGSLPQGKSKDTALVHYLEGQSLGLDESIKTLGSISSNDVKAIAMVKVANQIIDSPRASNLINIIEKNLSLSEQDKEYLLRFVNQR